MKRDSRLSASLHVLLHMAEHEKPMTSEVLARAMDTHPVVVRRMMAGLREAGFVQSGKGHGGGWTLASDLAEITLRDVYEALGRPTLWAVGNRSEKPECLVEKAVNGVLEQVFHDAESLLLKKLEATTLAALSRDFNRHVRQHRHSRACLEG